VQAHCSSEKSVGFQRSASRYISILPGITYLKLCVRYRVHVDSVHMHLHCANVDSIDGVSEVCCASIFGNKSSRCNE
jgi:hypothetical protein